jgi:Zn-finger nucleic acid-binding protein
MEAEKSYGIAIDLCPRHGVWLDRGELPALRRRVQVTQHFRIAGGEGPSRDIADSAPRLAALLGGPPHPNTRFVPEGERPCPVCRRQMATEERYGVTADVCADHGVWLDAGELLAIKRDAYELEARLQGIESARRGQELGPLALIFCATDLGLVYWLVRLVLDIYRGYRSGELGDAPPRPRRHR